MRVRHETERTPYRLPVNRTLLRLSVICGFLPMLLVAASLGSPEGSDCCGGSGYCGGGLLTRAYLNELLGEDDPLSLGGIGVRFRISYVETDGREIVPQNERRRLLRVTGGSEVNVPPGEVSISGAADLVGARAEGALPQKLIVDLVQFDLDSGTSTRIFKNTLKVKNGTIARTSEKSDGATVDTSHGFDLFVRPKRQSVTSDQVYTFDVNYQAEWNGLLSMFRPSSWAEMEALAKMGREMAALPAGGVSVPFFLRDLRRFAEGKRQRVLRVLLGAELDVPERDLEIVGGFTDRVGADVPRRMKSFIVVRGADGSRRLRLKYNHTVKGGTISSETRRLPPLDLMPGDTLEVDVKQTGGKFTVGDGLWISLNMTLPQ